MTRRGRVAGAVLAAALVMGCGRGGKADGYYFEGGGERQEDLMECLGLLEEGGLSGEERFGVTREIANIYAAAGDDGRLLNFLSREVRRQGMPYCGFYRGMAASVWERLGAVPVAVLCLEDVVWNCPDLIVNESGQSLHFVSLKRLADLVEDSVPRGEYCEMLLLRFIGEMDDASIGRACFYIAKAHEQKDNWGMALVNYALFLKYGRPSVPGYLDAEDYAGRLVALDSFGKTWRPKVGWTFESLDALESAVRSLIERKDAFRLERLRTGVGFFSAPLRQDYEGADIMDAFSVPDFLRDNEVTCGVLERDGEGTAYMLTRGWLRFPVWRLCFKRIYFPPDPELHGRWEWAGVYYDGEE